MESKISRFFKREEFACKCGCGFDTIDTETLAVVEDVRIHFDSPVFINSACRCEEHNKKVGGKPKSQHVLARATDIDVKNVKPSEVQKFLKEQFPNKYGIGSYENFTHIDTRKNKARWNG